MHGFFPRKSNEMDDLGVPPFQGTAMLIINECDTASDQVSKTEDAAPEAAPCVLQLGVPVRGSYTMT